MCQGVTIFVVFSGKTLVMVRTIGDGAFLGSFRLVCEHVSFEVLERPPAIRMGATGPLIAVVFDNVGIRSRTLVRVAGTT